jgi:Aconitase C-terminal domain
MPLAHHEQCFGRGRTNLFGLLLEAEPAADGRLTARCFIKQDHHGAEAGSAHEGIVAAALSEAMALACGIDARASRIEIQFTGSAPVGVFLGRGFIVAGHNYGQGSSPKHAALAPLHLRVKAVIAKSFARIHRRNLIAQGIAALTFADERDYDRAEVGQTWTLPKVRRELEQGVHGHRQDRRRR